MAGTRPLTDAEVRSLQGAFLGPFALRDRALFVLGYRTGFRISEILALQVRDLVREGRVVDRVTVARRNMKAKRVGRTVALHPEAQAAVQAWLEELGPMDPSAYLFGSRKSRGRPLTRRQALRVLTDAYRRLGLDGPLGTHSMRKTFAQRVHERLGRDVFKTQKALGHRSIQSTIHYLTCNQGEIDDAVLTA